MGSSANLSALAVVCDDRWCEVAEILVHNDHVCRSTSFGDACVVIWAFREAGFMYAVGPLTSYVVTFTETPLLVARASMLVALMLVALMEVALEAAHALWGPHSQAPLLARCQHARHLHQCNQQLQHCHLHYHLAHLRLSPHHQCQCHQLPQQRQQHRHSPSASVRP